MFGLSTRSYPSLTPQASAQLFRFYAGTVPQISCHPTHHVQENKRRLGRTFSNCSMRSRYGKLSWLDLTGAVEQPALSPPCGRNAYAGLSAALVTKSSTLQVRTNLPVRSRNDGSGISIIFRPNGDERASLKCVANLADCYGNYGRRHGRLMMRLIVGLPHLLKTLILSMLSFTLIGIGWVTLLATHAMRR